MAMPDHIKQVISDHWQSCEEGGLPHTATSRDQVLEAFDKYFTALKSANGDRAVLDAIRALYAQLDKINAVFGRGLLETDERELLVPIVIEAAEAAGIDSSKYDGEPGGEFRNF